MSDPSTGSGGPAAPAPAAPPPSERRSVDRPAPHPSSLLGALGGLLLLASLFLLLGELSGERVRLAGFALSLLFEVLGVALLVFARGRRSGSAGVALTALGVVPLLVFLFVDVRNPANTIDDVGSFTGTATAVLLAAAVLWLVAYLFGPGRRHALYLGAALLAVWLVAVVQIVDDPLSQVADGFASSATFVPVGPGVGTDPFDEDLSSDLGTDPFDDELSSEFGTDPFDDGFSGSTGFEAEADDLPTPDDPSAELGWVSLAFGVAYLGLGAWRDRERDHRMATAFLAVAAPVLVVAVGFLGSPLEATGTAVLAIALGGAAMVVGSRGGRRFTSWFGLLAVLQGVLTLVERAVGESLRASAVVLLVLGAVAFAVALRLEAADPDADEGPVPPVPRDPLPTAPEVAPWEPPAAPPGEATAPSGPASTPAPAPPGADPWAPPGATGPPGPAPGPPTAPG